MYYVSNYYFLYLLIGFNRIKIRVLNSLVTFNDHYELFANGFVRHNGFVDQLIVDRYDVKVKVENNRNPFSIRFHKWNRSYIFDVYPTGVLLNDPILRSLQYNDRNANAERDNVPNENQSTGEREQHEIEINQTDNQNESRENVGRMENDDRESNNQHESSSEIQNEKVEREVSQVESDADAKETSEDVAQGVVERKQLETEKVEREVSEVEPETEAEEIWEDVHQTDSNSDENSDDEQNEN